MGFCLQTMNQRYGDDVDVFADGSHGENVENRRCDFSQKLC